jgi:hypothetical protein
VFDQAAIRVVVDQPKRAVVEQVRSVRFASKLNPASGVGEIEGSAQLI